MGGKPFIRDDMLSHPSPFGAFSGYEREEPTSTRENRGPESTEWNAGWEREVSAKRITDRIGGGASASQLRRL